MHFFTSGVFWFIEGLLLCLVIIGFKYWIEDRGVTLSWWNWVLFIVWLLFWGFTIAFITTSLGESEPRAALLGGILFGLITIFSGFILWKIFMGRSENPDIKQE